MAGCTDPSSGVGAGGAGGKQAANNNALIAVRTKICIRWRRGDQPNAITASATAINNSAPPNAYRSVPLGNDKAEANAPAAPLGAPATSEVTALIFMSLTSPASTTTRTAVASLPIQTGSVPWSPTASTRAASAVPASAPMSLMRPLAVVQLPSES